MQEESKTHMWCDTHILYQAATDSFPAGPFDWKAKLLTEHLKGVVHSRSYSRNVELAKWQRALSRHDTQCPICLFIYLVVLVSNCQYFD